MNIAYRWQHPTEYDGEYPNWSGYAFLDWSKLGYWHEGADYNKGAGDQDFGQPIYMPGDGEMLWLGRHWPGYGSHCYTKHKLVNGEIVVCHFAHLKEWSIPVEFGVGAQIKRGELIAQVGNTGWNKMYAHLHFEIFTLEHWVQNVKPLLDEGIAFWPNPNKGWDKKRIEEFYYDPFFFIQDRLNAEEPSECEELKNALEVCGNEKKRYKKERNEAKKSLGKVERERDKAKENVKRLRAQEYTLPEAVVFALRALSKRKIS